MKEIYKVLAYFIEITMHSSGHRNAANLMVNNYLVLLKLLVKRQLKLHIFFEKSKIT